MKSPQPPRADTWKRESQDEALGTPLQPQLAMSAAEIASEVCAYQKFAPILQRGPTAQGMPGGAR